jgi:hypothetical protein
MTPWTTTVCYKRGSHPLSSKRSGEGTGRKSRRACPSPHANLRQPPTPYPTRARRRSEKRRWRSAASGW